MSSIVVRIQINFKPRPYFVLSLEFKIYKKNWDAQEVHSKKPSQRENSCWEFSVWTLFVLIFLGCSKVLWLGYMGHCFGICVDGACYIGGFMIWNGISVQILKKKKWRETEKFVRQIPFLFIRFPFHLRRWDYHCLDFESNFSQRNFFYYPMPFYSDRDWKCFWESEHPSSWEKDQHPLWILITPHPLSLRSFACERSRGAARGVLEVTFRNPIRFPLLFKGKLSFLLSENFEPARQFLGNRLHHVRSSFKWYQRFRVSEFIFKNNLIADYFSVVEMVVKIVCRT